jgi:type VI secretion system protein ImpM
VPVGFYGKLPSHSDFLHRGVTDEFVNRWDAWLQDGIARSRSDLGDAWLDVFLTSPLWRFALASGVVGGPVWAGILLPSVDRVGRYFPLTIVAELPPGVLPFELSVAGNSWFDWAESLARRTLDDELVDLNRLQTELLESDALLAAVRVPEVSPAPIRAESAPASWYPLAEDGDMGRFFARFADSLAPAAREPFGLWWSTGSDRIGPCVMMSRGLPPASAFRELLGGAQTTPSPAATRVDAALPPASALPPLGALAQTTPSSPDAAMSDTALPSASALHELLSGVVQTAPSAPAVVDTTPPPASAFQLLSGDLQTTESAPIATLIDSLLPPLAAVRWQSSAISDAGRVREENQDAFVERADAGLWLVADGMGGHQGGRMASQLVADHVTRLAATGDLATLARDVAAGIGAANTELRRLAETQPGFDGGSTVVALCARGEQGIALWAGDSRLYRLRGGELERLTRDHSVAEEEGEAPPGEAHMLTRAVGGADLLTLEDLHIDLRPGDRLLLCSDGLYGDLTPPEIAARLERENAARDLLALAMERGGSDNATAVVIAVSAAT